MLNVSMSPSSARLVWPPQEADDTLLSKAAQLQPLRKTLVSQGVELLKCSLKSNG